MNIAQDAHVSDAISARPACPEQPETTPLARAAFFGDHSAVATLLDAGTSPNGDGCETTPLMDALAPSIVDPGTPDKVVKARRAGKRRVVDLLLARGADVSQSDKDGTAALHSVAGADDDDVWLTDTVARLLQMGAPVDVPNRFGITPLMLAVDHRREGIARLLVAAGADPTAKSERGETPLSIARERGYAALVALFTSQPTRDAEPR